MPSFAWAAIKLAPSGTIWDDYYVDYNDDNNDYAAAADRKPSGQQQ